MRTLHVALSVSDLERSLTFYTGLGYEVVGRVPETEIGSLVMLKLPEDPFVSLELVEGAEAPAGTGGLHHLVVQVEDLRATVAALDRDGIRSAPPSSPDGTDAFLVARLTDPDGHEIELVQWPPGHGDGMTSADFVSARGAPSRER